MNSYERVKSVLSHHPVDLLPVSLTPWRSTLKRWRQEGFLGENEDIVEHFGLDIRYAGWINSQANLDAGQTVLEETAALRVIIDENGATIRQFKDHEAGNEYVSFSVKTRTDWEIQIKPHLLRLDERRIPFEEYTRERELAKAHNRFFFWRGLAPFEQMFRVCGHENLLMAMALEPQWIQDMVMTFCEMTIRHLDHLFAVAGEPDGFFFFEDMGFKEKPFFSAQMYREIMMPGHTLLFDYAHQLGKKVVVHSCGYVEPLIADMIEAGMDCLQALEVKAGMNLRRIFDLFGKRIALFGGLDARALMSNDPDQILAEAQQHVFPILQQGAAYLLHSDHSEPPQVDYRTARFFVNEFRELCSAQMADRLPSGSTYV